MYDVASEYSAKQKPKKPTQPVEATPASSAAAEVLRERLVEHTNEIISRQVDKHADKAAATVAKHLAKIDHLSGHMGPSNVWMRGVGHKRQPRLSRDDIAAVAMRIADDEGFEALTMRRLATELDVGTMSIYHYVHSKDELLTLVIDTFIDEILLPPSEPMPSTWRAAITLVANRRRAALERHPWVLDLTDDPPIGPNAMRYFDQIQEAVVLFPGTLADQLDLMMAVEEYVFGYCLNVRNNLRDTTVESDEFFGYIDELIATNDYPTLRKIAETSGTRDIWNQVKDHYRDARRFERNLNRLLDGFEKT
jgi:AcrR family transcriptional regulator